MVRLMEDLVGGTLSGRYRLVSRLAGGGMGEVYRGHDLLLDRPVAVKVLQPSLAADAELVERFKDEARAAARLTHPNVVGVYDWGAADESTYYMVMEYVAGNDLRDLLVTRGPLEPAQAAEVVAAVCDALAAAHAGGLVHRDVKPENVLIARDGTVKVADFGIAVVVDSDHTFPGGGLPGTLRYLAPEQAQGYEATWASDIWAAGAVLSELLTGQPPLQGAGADLLHRRASEPPLAPSSVAPGVPPELDAIVLRACALDPAERFEDASYMAHELRRTSIRSLPEAPPVERLLGELTGELELERAPRGPLPGARRRGRGLLRLVGTVAKLFLVLVVVAALALGGWRAAPFLFGPADVEVPDLTGLSRARAMAEAEAAGLTTEISSRRRVFGQPRGEVIAQSPARGSLEEGSVVSLVLSAGPPLTDVPDVVGATRARAAERLRSAGLVAGPTVERFAEAQPGTVVAQNPSGGMIESGGRVRLEISKGPRPRSVPDVAEMSSLEAVKALKRAGFVPVIEKTYSDEVPPRAVIGTRPRAGALTPPASEVKLLISAGPRYRELVLPDVRGRSAGAARAALERVGLRVRVVDSCNGGTVVVESDPIAGTLVRENDPVALFLC